MAVKTTVHKQIEAFNRQDSAGMGALYATTAVVVDPQYSEPLQGMDAIVGDYSEWFTAFLDTRATLTSLLANDETYAYEGTMTGTQLGPLAGPNGQIPPTNNRFASPFAIFGRLDNQGRIVEEHRYFDPAGILAQIGVST